MYTYTILHAKDLIYNLQVRDRDRESPIPTKLKLVLWGGDDDRRSGEVRAGNVWENEKGIFSSCSGTLYTQITHLGKW